MVSDYYTETDRISPHFNHRLQVWGDGVWQCLTCEGMLCDRCHEVNVHGEGERCPECVQEAHEAREQDYYDALAKDEGGQG